MGAIDLARAQGSLALTLGADQGVEQIIFTPANVYIHPPANQTRSGKPWEASSFADTGSFAQLLFQVESIDPGFTLAEVSAGAVMASTAGHVMVNGSETSRYVVTVDVNRAYKGVTGPGAAGYAEGLSTELNAKPTLTLVVDIDNLDA